MKVKALNLVAGLALVLWSVVAMVHAFTLFSDSLATVYALFLIVQSLLIALFGLKVLRNKFLGRAGLVIGASAISLVMFLAGWSVAVLNFQSFVVLGVLVFALGHMFSKYNFKLVPGIVFGVIAIGLFLFGEVMGGGFLAFRMLFDPETWSNTVLSLSHYAALIALVTYVVASIVNSSEENTAEVEKIKKDKKEFFENVPEGGKRRRKSIAVLCAFFLGFLGGLAFYEGKFVKGIIKAFTVNYFLVGYFIDLVYALKLPKYYEVK